jgi:transposase
MASTRVFKLTKRERADLEEITRRQSAEHRQVFRARIILMVAAGVPVAAIARQLSTTRVTVRQWRDRFFNARDIEALNDLPRSGRPSRVPVEVRCELVKLACTRPDPKRTKFRESWTRGALREALRRETGCTLSITEVGRVLRTDGIRPHRTRMWLHSPDPDFRKRVRAICSVYADPPRDATILCVDEKTCIQALTRKREAQPATAGRPVRVEFEYRRQGTRTLLGAFDIRTGKVLAHVRQRRTAADLDAFMEAVATRHPVGDVYIVWDNLNTHCGAAWERFNARHGNRFHFLYTPKHASWVNQIEIWFGILQRRVLRNASFSSVLDLERRLVQFVQHWNRHEAHPFRWTFRGRFAQHSAARLAA